MSCQFPFTVAEICPGGDMYTCCPVFTSSYSLGNIYQDSFEAIWNGERAKHLRCLLLNNDFTLCDLSKCTYYQGPKDLSQYTEITPYPTKVIFGHDPECNCKCITCRDTICANSREELAELDSKIETHFLPMLQKARIAYFAGNGDPFASRHYRKLIQRAAEAHPSLRFDLHTNGLLCSRKQLQELGILDRLNSIALSIHACTPETYAKIVPGSSFEKVWGNLTEVSVLQREGLLPGGFTGYFVVHALNVEEMVPFTEHLLSLGGVAWLWEARDFGTSFTKDRANIDVMNPEHPKHELLIDNIIKLKTMGPNVGLSPAFLNLIAPQEVKVVKRKSVRPPVFLHSLPHSCGTSFFKALRHKKSYCYADPYNPVLAGDRLTALAILARDTVGETGEGSYPDLPLYQEFAPFMTYGADMPWYSPHGSGTEPLGELPSEEKTYLARLIEYANEKGRIPVLQCTETAPHIGMLRKMFGGTHIMLMRDPHDLFMSFLEKNEDGFLKKMSDLMETFHWLMPNASFAETSLNTHHSYIAWDMFSHIYILVCSIAAIHSDMVVDVTKMSQDVEYKTFCRERIQALTDIPPDLENFNLPPDACGAFYNPYPLWTAYRQVLGSDEKKERFIAKVAAWADLPALEVARQNLLAVEECLFRTAGENIPERFGDQWHTLKRLEGLAQKIDKLVAMNLTSADHQDVSAQKGNVEARLLDFLKKVAHKFPEPVEAELKRIWRKLKDLP